MLEEKMVHLRERLMEMASLAEAMISRSIKGLAQKDSARLREVLDRDEPRVNDLEIEIDELCASIIALYEPRAKDLRQILMILKMNADLERIGDHAVNMCQSAEFLIERPPVKPLVDIPQMADETMSMIRDSITAFIQEDPALATTVLQRDDRIDAYRDQIIRELITYMLSDASTIERALHLILITQNLERVADLSTNIGEYTIYMVDGKVVKHGRQED